MSNAERRGLAALAGGEADGVPLDDLLDEGLWCAGGRPAAGPSSRGSGAPATPLSSLMHWIFGGEDPKE